MVNFTQCEAEFLNNQTTRDRFSYHGLIWNDDGHNHSYITYEGCNVLCRKGPEFYPWRTSADAILTWVLPMLVMFLMAPFEPNQTRNTLVTSIRWLGSPVVSMWYILCNIQIGSRCAQMVDMIVPYSTCPGDETDASDFRDAMLILSFMNQYLLDPLFVSGNKRMSECAEQVLWIALFGNLETSDMSVSLRERRRKVATTIRTRRRGGIVPILLGLVWFLFVLALSINFTFQNIGENAAGFNLGMGFAVSWITPLVVGVVVDRNATATKDLGLKLNRLFAQARTALRSMHGNYEQFMLTNGLPKHASLHVDNVMLESLPQDLFVDFAGQGRLRWHRSVAHPVLAGIERSYAAEQGRGWFEHGEHAKAAMLVPNTENGFCIVERRLLLQFAAALTIIYGNLGAGFLISYYTPPVGISCRAFSYLVFGAITILVTLIEAVLEAMGGPETATRRLGHRGLVTLEAINVCWLLGTIIAQTFGFYQTCFCASSAFPSQGGYIQFDDMAHDDSDATIIVWSISVGVASFVLLASLVYFVVEWLVQSHLNTSDHRRAQRGLLWTRRYKRFHSWVLFGPTALTGGIMMLVRVISRSRPRAKTRMVWSR